MSKLDRLLLGIAELSGFLNDEFFVGNEGPETAAHHALRLYEVLEEAIGLAPAGELEESLSDYKSALNRLTIGLFDTYYPDLLPRLARAIQDIEERNATFERAQKRALANKSFGEILEEDLKKKDEPGEKSEPGPLAHLESFFAEFPPRFRQFLRAQAYLDLQMNAHFSAVHNKSSEGRDAAQEGPEFASPRPVDEKYHLNGASMGHAVAATSELNPATRTAETTAWAAEPDRLGNGGADATLEQSVRHVRRPSSGMGDNPGVGQGAEPAAANPPGTVPRPPSEASRTWKNTDNRSGVSAEQSNQRRLMDMGDFVRKFNVPEFDGDSDTWVKNVDAAEIESVGVKTLREYRSHPSSIHTSDKKAGRDRDGRIWRRDPERTDRSHPFYLVETLRNGSRKPTT